MSRVQKGYLYEASGAFFVRYNTGETKIVDGKTKWVQRSHRLCEKSDKYYALNAKAVKLLRDDFMLTVNRRDTTNLNQDMSVVDYWEKVYLPYCEEIVKLTGQPRKKPSTLKGYRQIWKQHLKDHFGKLTLQEYEPRMGTRFLQSLTSTQGKTTLKHIKALGGSLFKKAVDDERIKTNPWHDVSIPEDAIEPENTPHYTLEEAENIISALVENVDAQLVMALSCFLGLRPSEIAGLRWEDFDESSVHIRRAVVNGVLGTTKTKEATASAPVDRRRSCTARTLADEIGG
jgi:hypothetical protein